MSAKLIKEARDVALWWTQNRDRCSDLPTKVEFLTRANDHLLWLLGRTVQDLVNLEHRKHNDNAPNIVLPLGVKLHDSIRARA